MASPKTAPRPTLTAESIATWRTLDDAPALRELARERRTLREQRKVLLITEREHLALLAAAHKEKQARLAQMGHDVSGYPAFDPATVKDAVLQECRDALLAVDDALLQAETAFEAQAAPVSAEFSAVQKGLMVHLMDRALEALDIMEDVGVEGEHLCMQSFGCVGSYITNIALFQRMQRWDRAVLQAERDRLSYEVEAFYG